MSSLINWLKILFSKAKKPWNLLFFVSFSFWSIGAFLKQQWQEPLAILGFGTLILALWIILSTYPVQFWGIDFKIVIIWLIICILSTVKIQESIKDIHPTPWQIKAIWITYPYVISLSSILPDFVTPQLRITIPPRLQVQKDLIVIFSSLLVSCWINFYFVIDQWILNDSKLAQKDMSKSLFVLKSEEIIPGQR